VLKGRARNGQVKNHSLGDSLQTKGSPLVCVCFSVSGPDESGGGGNGGDGSTTDDTTRRARPTAMLMLTADGAGGEVWCVRMAK
jgi:hypothetical protein